MAKIEYAHQRSAWAMKTEVPAIRLEGPGCGDALDKALASLDGPVPISPGIVRYSDAKGYWWDLDEEDDPKEILGPVLAGDL